MAKRETIKLFINCWKKVLSKLLKTFVELSKNFFRRRTKKFSNQNSYLIELPPNHHSSFLSPKESKLALEIKIESINCTRNLFTHFLINESVNFLQRSSVHLLGKRLKFSWQHCTIDHLNFWPWMKSILSDQLYMSRLVLVLWFFGIFYDLNLMWFTWNSTEGKKWFSFKAHKAIK